MSGPIPSRCLWDESPGNPNLEAVVDLPDEADVVIVGAGFTGLWTAFYLSELDPSLRVAVIESRHVGFGASGRNGGWSSAVLPMSLGSMARRHGQEMARRFDRAMKDSVDEVVTRARSFGVGETVAKGGYVQVARGVPQWERLRESVDEARAFGVEEADLRLLDATETLRHVRATDVIGSVFTPHCAAVAPGDLVRALGAECRRRGIDIVEGVSVLSIETGLVVTDHGPIRTRTSVRATEAFTSRLPRQRRTMLPLYSLMIATEPVPDEILDQIVSPHRPTFNDGRHLLVYGQRTADGRIAFGGRGAPYHFGSRIDPTFDTNQRVALHLADALRELFPALREVGISHHWGGPLAAPRDWTCSVRYDAGTGLASAGGYVGDGVTTTNLAGRTLADLITGRSTALTSLPWVGHDSRRWEPEPLRWFAVNAMTRLADLADRREARTGRRAAAIERLLGLALGD